MISLAELKERKLVQWGVAYLAGAWLVLQVVGLLSDAYAWPPLVLRILPIVLLAGFFGALIVAWYHGVDGAQRVSRMEIAMLTALLVIGSVGVRWTRGVAAAPVVTTVVDQLARTEKAVEERSIAVLPFVNMSSDPEQEYFSDGLTEELLNVLAQIPELRVAARTSAFAFKGKDVGIDSIGRALNVAHVLEGSVRTAGDQIRVTAQLIDARNGFHLWSETYDRAVKDVFAVQDEISRAVVAQLRIALVGDAPLAKQETTDPEAHTLLLRGIAAHRQGRREGFAEAERLFVRAIERDPDYANAHARLATTLQLRAAHRHIPHEEGFARARATAQRALALDPDAYEAHATLGRVADSHDWDFAEAERHYRLGIANNPGDGGSRSLLAWLLMRRGQREEALRQARRSVELDPLSMAAFNNLGAVYSFAGQLDDAVDAYRASIALAPGSAAVRSNLALTLSDLGRHAEAIETAERGRALDAGDHFIMSSLGYVYARAGRTAEAQRALAALLAQPNASPYLIATVYAGMGDIERAFQLLEHAVDIHDDQVPDLSIDPVFNQMRGDPRMQRLLERIGLS